MNLDRLLNMTDFQNFDAVEQCYDATWSLAKALNETILGMIE